MRPEIEYSRLSRVQGATQISARLAVARGVAMDRLAYPIRDEVPVIGSKRKLASSRRRSAARSLEVFGLVFRGCHSGALRFNATAGKGPAAARRASDDFNGFTSARAPQIRMKSSSDR